ncbi:MAG: HrcA family transcriptional regulator, partial [Clostridiales bacterium]|nr:HrcA family transcriptional regulator [Clostridiales bacterium]
MLDERKKRVLQAVIESYIETGEPVGSRTVSKMQELNFSPATIRNEMADLEDMGYLEQPHVSAGRIPSDLGYRYYIENIMNKPALPQDEMRDLQRLINEKAAQVKELIREIAELYTRLIKYTVFALPVEMSEEI